MECLQFVLEGKPNVVIDSISVGGTDLICIIKAQMADQMIDRYRRESEPNA